MGQRKQVRNFLLVGAAAAIGDGGSEAESISRMEKLLCMSTTNHNARINRFSDGFFPSTSHLWNSLPSAVFPASFNLPSFKRQVYHHLRDQMA